MYLVDFRGRRTSSILLLYYNLIRSFFLFLRIARSPCFHFRRSPLWCDSFYTENTVGMKLTHCTTSSSCSYTDPVFALGSNHFVQYTLGTFLYIIFPIIVSAVAHMITIRDINYVLPDIPIPCTNSLISVISMGLAAAFTDVMDPLPVHPRPP